MAQKRKRSKQAIPKDESNSDRFVRVVTPRVNKAVKAIGVIGFCSGATYEYTPSQAKQICKLLHSIVDSLESKLERKPEAQQGFTFDG